MKKSFPAFLVAALVGVGLVCAPLGATHAADSGKKRGGMLSERSYKRLAQIHELIGDEKYAEALKLLDPLYAGVGHNDYEKAIILQTYGYIYASQNRYREAIKYMEQCLAIDILPEQATQNMIFNVAQLYMAIEDYKRGLQTLEEWFKTAENPPPNAYALAATAYAQLQKFRQAVPYIKKAVETSDDPKESWFQLWLAMHYELKEYPQAAAVLEEMVRRFPDREKYWKQLSTIYLELKQDGKALSALELAYAQGYLRTENELVQLANLYMYQGIPYEAAQVLQHGLDKGIIKPDKKHWEALGNAYMEARENEKAIPALQKAAEASDDGDIDLRVAYLFLEKEQWDKAADSLAHAIRKGGLDDPGMAYLLLGMASYERKNYDDALQQFNKARNYDKRKDQAVQWINHIRNELAAAN